MSAETLPALLDFAQAIAWEAGRLTLAYYANGTLAEYKEDDTPVTVADRQAEKHIRGRIEKAYPHHAILGEEYGDSGTKASHRWIIDPIDGTKSFISGVPLYGVLIGLEIEGVSQVGAMYFPALDILVAGANGLGCSWNGRACRVSEKADLSRAIIAHADTASFAKFGKGQRWSRLQNAVYYNAGWCDAYGYALVAGGRIDLMLDPAMNIWDAAPLLPILREAGGYFGDWRGQERIDGNEGLATNRHLLPGVLDLLRAE